jgi:hypothetical protein
MSKQTHTCGYRVVQGRASAGSPFHGCGPNLDYYREDDSCSYCGSLNPAIFMERLERGDVELGPTDKDYKVYVRNLGGSPFKQTYRDGCPTSPCPDIVGEGGSIDVEKCTHWVTREREETKFYFYHLDAEQRLRFIELYNQQKMKLGMPHYFYMLPFFCRAATKGD